MPPSKGFALPVRSVHGAERRAPLTAHGPHPRRILAAEPRASARPEARNLEAERRLRAVERERALGRELRAPVERLTLRVAQKNEAGVATSRVTRFPHLAGAGSVDVKIAAGPFTAIIRFPGLAQFEIQLPGYRDGGLRMDVAPVPATTTDAAKSDSVPAAFLTSPFRWFRWALPREQREREELTAMRALGESEETFALALRLRELIHRATIERAMEEGVENRVAVAIARRNREAMGLLWPLYAFEPTVSETGLLAEA